MGDECVFDDSALDISIGRYVVYDEDGGVIIQGDDLEAVIAEARANGVSIPALIDLEIARDDLLFIPTSFIIEAE